MGLPIDHTDKRYGRLLAIRRVTNDRNQPRWECRCDCGKTTYVDGYLLGRTKSCGCLRERSHLIHGGTKNKASTREYAAWSTAKQRCTNPKNVRYEQYGARGITMCERWLTSFAAFVEDMGPAPKGMTLERIDTNRGYEPTNCRWASRLEQANNKRTNHLIPVDGELVSIAEAARRLGVEYGTLNSRIQRGWSAERAITAPLTPLSVSGHRAGRARHGLPSLI